MLLKGQTTFLMNTFCNNLLKLDIAISLSASILKDVWCD